MWRTNLIKRCIDVLKAEGIERETSYVDQDHGRERFRSFPCDPRDPKKSNKMRELQKEDCNYNWKYVDVLIKMSWREIREERSKRSDQRERTLEPKESEREWDIIQNPFIHKNHCDGSRHIERN